MVFFVGKELKAMYIKREIFCPKCKNKVATYDGKATVNIIARCRKCRKRIIYNVETRETLRVDIPQNLTSSGKMFF